MHEMACVECVTMIKPYMVNTFVVHRLQMFLSSHPKNKQWNLFMIQNTIDKCHRRAFCFCHTQAQTFIHHFFPFPFFSHLISKLSRAVSAETVGVVANQEREAKKKKRQSLERKKERQTNFFLQHFPLETCRSVSVCRQCARHTKKKVEKKCIACSTCRVKSDVSSVKYRTEAYCSWVH